MVEFFNMGGYGFFVWTSYAIVSLVLGYHYFFPLYKYKKLIRNLAIFHQSNPNQ